LSQDIRTYDYASFSSFVRKEIQWDSTSGVFRAPRRSDCGGRCIYDPADPNNKRTDSPPLVLADNAPICDADKIDLQSIPPHGVLIGRVTYQRSVGGGPPRNGDASFNIGDGLFGGKRRRDPDHYVLLTKGMFVIPEYHAIWKLVALLRSAGNQKDSVVVVDSGLFRVCLPTHSMPDSGAVLASFRSCAEASESRALSMRRDVQIIVLGNTDRDSVSAQHEVYSRLIRGDRAAFDSVLVLRRSLFPGLLEARRDDAPEPAPAYHGPFARSTESYFSPLNRRSLFDYRYGDLHVDAPLWYVCHGGCCSGEPW